jgi:hypothetical protein
MRPSTTAIRATAVVGILAASVLGGAPLASATESVPGSGEGPRLLNWTSSMTGVLTGFQSRRWSDSQYSQVSFTGCDSYFNTSTHVDLRWDRTLQPDRSWGVKRFTACFGGGTSSGEWHDLESGEHFFQITQIDDRTKDSNLTVSRVSVDTSAAD